MFEKENWICKKTRIIQFVAEIGLSSTRISYIMDFLRLSAIENISLH